MKANNTITIDEVIGQYCDNHDFVILSNSKVNKDGTFWITTDDGREKVTMDILAREFGIVAYCGNGVYKMKGEDGMIKATDNIALCESAVFVSEGEYARKCKEVGLTDCHPSAFAEEFGYTAVIAVKRNGERGWACFF